MALDDFDKGFLIGLLVGEGHFGGDGKQAQITLRMHIRHEKTFRWLQGKFPNSKLYGPYSHGGRVYYQWMARGVFLKEEILPILLQHSSYFDDHIASRIQRMCQMYGLP